MNIFQSLLSFKHNPYMVLKPMQMVSSEYWKKASVYELFQGFWFSVKATHKQTTKSRTNYMQQEKQLKLTAKILTRS